MRTLLLSSSLSLFALVANAQSTARAPQSPAAPETAPDAAARIDGLPQRVLFDQQRADGPLWAVGRTWKAGFDATGMTMVPFFGSAAPQNFPLRFEVRQATVGGEPLVLTAGRPRVDGQAVRTDRGAFVEVIDTALDQVEQSFVFASLPNRGEVAVEVAVDTVLSVQAIDGGLRFANEFGHVDYTRAFAVDARGRRIDLPIGFRDGAVQLAIPAEFVAAAELPLTLDPVLNAWYNLGSGIAAVQHDSDVASIQATALHGRTLLVWQRDFSASDTDCYGLMFDGGLGLVQTDFVIDASLDDWTHVAVAGNNYAQNFLVVAEVRIPVFLGNQHYIAGRGVSANAAVQPVFDIEREGVVGIAGNDFHPDVGGDPYYGVGRYTVVFQKVVGFTADIYMKQVSTAFALVTTNAIALDTSTSEEQKPTIGKSCGQPNGLEYWLVTWQRTYSASDQDVYGRFVNWNGGLPGSVFPVGVLAANETAPSAGSPIDAGGVRYWPVAFEQAASPGQLRDVWCRLMASNGAALSSFMVNTAVPGADEHDPEIDSDGTRFTTVYMSVSGSGFPTPEAVCAAWVTSTNTFRVEERNGLQTSGLESYGECNVCADFSGGNTVSPRYFVSFSHRSNNTLDLKNYAGFAGGTLFFTTRASQCGNLPISVTGSPVIGQTVVASVAGGSPLAGTILGFPGFLPLNALGCNCWQGVDQGIYLGNPLSWTVPNDPVYVGLQLSVQGWNIVGNQCLGFVDLSDTVDFTIR